VSPTYIAGLRALPTTIRQMVVTAVADKEIGGQYCENCHVGKIVADELFRSHGGSCHVRQKPDNLRDSSIEFTAPDL